MAATVLSLNSGEIPVTRNYNHADPDCPVNVVHRPQRATAATAIVLSQATMGQAVAVALAGA